MPFRSKMDMSILKPIRGGHSLLDDMSTLHTKSEGDTFASDDPFAILRSTSLNTDDESSRRIWKTKSWSTGGSTYEETPFISRNAHDQDESRYELKAPANSFPNTSEYAYEKMRGLTMARAIQMSRRPYLQKSSKIAKPLDYGSKASIQTSTTSEKLSTVADTRDPHDDDSREYTTLYSQSRDTFLDSALRVLQSSVGFCADGANYVCPASPAINIEESKTNQQSPKPLKRAEKREEVSEPSIASLNAVCPKPFESNKMKNKTSAPIVPAKAIEAKPLSPLQFLRGVQNSMKGSFFNCSEKYDDDHYTSAKPTDLSQIQNKAVLSLNQDNQVISKPKTINRAGIKEQLLTTPRTNGNIVDRRGAQRSGGERAFTVQKFSVAEKKKGIPEITSRDPPVLKKHVVLTTSPNSAMTQPTTSARSAAMTMRASAIAGQHGLHFGKGEVDSLPRRRQTLREAMHKLSEDHNSGRKDSAKIRKMKVDALNGTPESPIDLTMMP